MRHLIALLAILTLSTATAHAWGGSSGRSGGGGSLGSGAWRSGGNTYGGSSRVGGHDTPPTVGVDTRAVTGGPTQASQANAPTTARADSMRSTNRSTMARNIGFDSRDTNVEPAAAPAPLRRP